ncbi:uncharacterized protein LOC131214517 [Anopheles bellator]|uniref:uncharacterized protein LOC131214517 n=1 Tax=Anopheles bellator TaxID=139047 RepID=UPI0026475A74|nr:uncharacterized protein LOC131214517 [Anopheles bellator]
MLPATTTIEIASHQIVPVLESQHQQQHHAHNHLPSNGQHVSAGNVILSQNRTNLASASAYNAQRILVHNAPSRATVAQPYRKKRTPATAQAILPNRTSVRVQKLVASGQPPCACCKNGFLLARRRSRLPR